MQKNLIKYFEIISLIIGVFIGFCINWITDLFKTSNIYVPISIIIVILIIYYFLIKIKNKLNNFEYNLENGKRKKEEIYDREIRICEDNSSFQIKKGDEYENYSTSWTQVYPNKYGSGKYIIELKTNGNIIKTINWAYCDGGRISVPIPKLQSYGNGDRFYWEKNSLEFKVAKAIGGTGDIEKVAKESGIEII